MYRPEFTISNKLLTYISDIEASKQIVENAPLIPAWERRFQQEAEVRTVHFSTKIEGNVLDFDEAKKVFEGEKVRTFRRRDIKEIANYREVIHFINGLKKQPVDENLLLQIHTKVMDGILSHKELGTYRTCEEALIDSSTYEVVFEPVEPEYIEGEIGELFSWLDTKAKDVHPIIKAGILCYELVRIHPFVDGNGRTARLIATYSLYQDGYDIKKFFSLEEYYDQNLEAYYNSLESVEQNDGDLTKWLEFFGHGLAVELSRIRDKVLGLSKEVKMRKVIGQVALNERQIILINEMQDRGFVQNKDWQTLFPNVSDDTILRDLKDLQKKKIVKKTGRTKAARYVLK